MTSYEISMEEYEVLRDEKKPFNTNHEIVEGDRLFILSKCKINKYYLDEYLENNYENVKITKNILNATVIIGNPNNFNYLVNIGYQYQDTTFINEDQWKLYIASTRPIKDKKPKKAETTLLKDSYQKEDMTPQLKFEDAIKTPYIQLYDDDLQIETVVAYNEGRIKVIDELVLINRIDTANNLSKYELTDVEDIIALLETNKKDSINAAITALQKIHRDTVITKIVPYYYSDNLSKYTKQELYDKILTKITIIKELLLVPEKALYTNYSRSVESLRRIRSKTKLEFDKDSLIRSFING